jgi:pre-mRNA-splicing factor 18
MDFASLMKQQISAAKSSTKSDSNENKYVKRSEIEAKRREEYQADLEALDAERRQKLEKKRQYEEVEAEKKREREDKKRRLAEESKKRREEEEYLSEQERRKRLGLPELPPQNSEENDTGNETEDIDEETVVEQLRKRGEPVKLFGETSKQRIQRWKHLTERERSNATPILTDGPIPTTIELVPEAEMKVPEKAPKDADGKKYLFRQLASYFTMVLKEWEIALANRTEEVKSSYQGKAAYNSMIQARENLRPLFKKIEKADIDDSILDPVVEIIHAAQERRYVDANDGYLRLSIGKA